MLAVDGDENTKPPAAACGYKEVCSTFVPRHRSKGRWSREPEATAGHPAVASGSRLHGQEIRTVSSATLYFGRVQRFQGLGTGLMTIVALGFN